MGEYERKYKAKEDASTREFHKSRRMFCIKGDKLYIAKPGLPFSHAAWFEMEGWSDEHDDRFMNENVRGVVFKNGEVRFYVGYDFRVTDESEKTFFKHLPELVRRLCLNPNAKVTAGQKGKKYLPIKEYGTISSITSSGTTFPSSRVSGRKAAQRPRKV